MMRIVKGADRCRYHYRIRPSRKLLHGEKAVKKSVTPLLFKGDGACDQQFHLSTVQCNFEIQLGN
jgi:hypothetical protein